MTSTTILIILALAFRSILEKYRSSYGRFHNSEVKPTRKLQIKSANTDNQDCRVAALDCDDPVSIELTRYLSKAGNYYFRNKIPPGLSGYSSIEGDGFYTYKIAGCLHYQEALNAVSFGRRKYPVYFRCNALVRPDFNNIYDRHPVAIEIDGQLVGYVPRTKAEAFRSKLLALPNSTVQCSALVENGVPNWFVKLDLSEPLNIGKSGRKVVKAQKSEIQLIEKANDYWYRP